jgi:hypothetical protein
MIDASAMQSRDERATAASDALYRWCRDGTEETHG